MKISEKLKAVPFPNAQFFEGEFAPNVYICERAEGALKLDGDVFKPFWAKAAWTQAFDDIEGSIRPKPQKDVKAKVLYDDEYLYIGGIIYDEQIWANVTERDAVIFADNDFEFFLDRNGSTHDYVELELNAMGTLWDLMLNKPYRDGGEAINAYDFSGIKWAVKVDGELNNPAAANKYWSVEIMIPWKNFGDHYKTYPAPKEGDYHRFNISRVEWHAEVKNGKFEKVINPETGAPYPEDNWVYAPTGLINIHYPELWAFLVYSDGNLTNFEIPEIERVKWALRKVYYAERAYMAKNGVFTMDIDEKLFGGYNVKISADISAFHAYAEHGGFRANIREDGYTWIEEV